MSASGVALPVRAIPRLDRKLPSRATHPAWQDHPRSLLVFRLLLRLPRPLHSRRQVRVAVRLGQPLQHPQRQWQDARSWMLGRHGKRFVTAGCRHRCFSKCRRPKPLHSQRGSDAIKLSCSSKAEASLRHHCGRDGHNSEAGPHDKDSHLVPRALLPQPSLPADREARAHAGRMSFLLQLSHRRSPWGSRQA